MSKIADQKEKVKHLCDFFPLILKSFIQVLFLYILTRKAFDDALNFPSSYFNYLLLVISLKLFEVPNHSILKEIELNVCHTCLFQGLIASCIFHVTNSFRIISPSRLF